ncbi:MAG: S8 family peptidase [Planctomycetota bacterium]|jgi:hypothetical protein
MNKHLAPWLMVPAMALPLAAQDPDRAASSTIATAAATAAAPTDVPADVHGLPGDRPGTERWIVHFKTRSFDLSNFRTAIYARRPATEVEKIVADLEHKVRIDQAKFTHKVESELGADVVMQWWLINACAIDVPFANLEKVRALPNVARLEPNQAWRMLIKRSTNSSNHNADFVQQVLKIDGSGVAVGILDTGQNDTVSTTIARPHRTYFVNGDPTNTSGTGIKNSRLILNKQIGKLPANDVDGHGTAVASVAAGGNWGTTGADHGQAFGANIAGYAIANQLLGGASDSATMVTAWQTLSTDRTKHNIVTANLSYEGSPSVLDSAQKALDSVALNADVLCCVACGNSGGSTLKSQGAANGIAVGAITADTHKVASFSGRGPLSGSGRFYPDIVACGVEMVMAQVGNETTDAVNTGTSFASPQVCGAAALVRAANTKLTALETKAILLATTKDITKQNSGATRNYYGLGMLRSDVAVQMALTKSGVGTSTVNTTTKTVTFPMSVTKDRQYAAVVTWYRTVLTSATYSNLDIRVLDGTTEVAKSKTAANLYENVVFTAKKTGSFTLEVTATALSGTSQDFAYAFTVLPVPAVVASLGKGCMGSGIALPAVCQSNNTNRTLAKAIGSDGWVYALEVNSSADVSITGYELRTDSQSTRAKPVTTYLYDSNVSGRPNNILASGIMLVGQSAAWYRTIFNKKVLIKKGQTYYLGFLNPPFLKGGSIRLPVTTSGNTMTCWRRKNATSSWIADTSRPMTYKTLCAGAGGAVPVAGTIGHPVINTPFTATLRQALAGAPTMLVVGLSKTKGFGTTLPWDLTSYGAPKCSILVSGDILVPLKVDANGGIDMFFILPNDKNAVGLTVYTQFAVQDQQANLLGWAFSNALGLTIGG